MKITAKILKKIILQEIDSSLIGQELRTQRGGTLDYATSRRQAEEEIDTNNKSISDFGIDMLDDSTPEPMSYDNYTERTNVSNIVFADRDDLISLTENELSDVLDGSRVIGLGARGKDVELIQTMLVQFLQMHISDEELLDLMGTYGTGGVGVDGIYGSGTEKAVARAQEIAQNNDMPYVQVDGDIGKQTLELLMFGDQNVTFEDPTPYTPTSQPQDSGDNIEPDELLVDLPVANSVSSAMQMDEIQYLKYPEKDIYKLIYPDGRVMYGEYNEFATNSTGDRETVNAVVPVRDTRFLQNIEIDNVSDDMWQKIDITQANFSRFPE